MFVKKVKIKRGNKRYDYAQLVQSYRKPDGTPSHRVVCNLKGLSPQAIDNLSTALQASRDNKSVIVNPEVVSTASGVEVAANLRYLDIATVYRAWQQLGLDTMMADLLGRNSSKAIAAHEVVAALVAHRCTAPDSKLAASRWYPRTALPELQGIKAGQFNNSRVHRVLSALEDAEDSLQACLPEHLRSQEGPFVSLFMDVTDTYFEGRGPAMAHATNTKEGVVRRKIGLVMLCDKRGFPIRWETLAGDYYEGDAMGSLVEKVAALDWAQKVPIVLDRMMGKADSIRRMAETEIRFITAIPRNEFESWSDQIPWASFENLVLSGTKTWAKQDLARVQAAAKRAKLKAFRDDRWVMDLGVVTRSNLGPCLPAAAQGVNGKVMCQALLMRDKLKTGQVISVAQLAQRQGCSRKSIDRALALTKLVPGIQQRVLAGELEQLTLGALRKIAISANQDKELSNQIAAVHHLVTQGTKKKGTPPKIVSEQAEPLGIKVRLVVTFNPEAFIEKRLRALERCRELEALVADLNRRLQTSSGRRRKEASVLGEVEKILRKWAWLQLFDIKVARKEAGEWHVELVRNEENWLKRRRYDGFCLFAAHPDIPMSSTEIITLYYAKDAIEKNFRSIKSEIELRPINHRTDCKVRAHVTLCVLALLVDRYLEQQLRKSEIPASAATLLEMLAPVHLNLLKVGTKDIYAITEIDQDQRAMLMALGMVDLVEDSIVSKLITPRRRATL